MSVSWFDRAIATVAPRVATRRVLARQVFEGLARSYEGAARGRRTDGWHAPGSSADVIECATGGRACFGTQFVLQWSLSSGHSSSRS